MNKQYWFYIDSYVHIALKKDNLLLYNPYTGSFLEYAGQPEILKLMGQVLAPDNLRVVLLTLDDWSNPAINDFINKTREHFMGDFIAVADSDGKPAQMPPFPKIKKDVKVLKRENVRSVGEDLLSNMSSLTLYVNNRCSQGCSICSEAFHQFPCCTAGKKGYRCLDIDQIALLLVELKNAPLVNITISGGDIFQYPGLDQLITLLDSRGDTTINYIIHYGNAVAHRHELKKLAGKNTGIKMPVPFPVDTETLKIAFESCQEENIGFMPLFIIRNEDDFCQAGLLEEKYGITNAFFHAFFDGTNYDFFRENIYIDREDIMAARPSLKDIYARTFVNPTTFGCLTVLPDNRIVAAINSSAVGTLGKDSIFDVLTREMENGVSWRKTRGKVQPCRNCTFEHLCPPLSNYNSVIGKNNLCHIVP